MEQTILTTGELKVLIVLIRITKIEYFLLICQKEKKSKKLHSYINLYFKSHEAIR